MQGCKHTGNTQLCMRWSCHQCSAAFRPARTHLECACRQAMRCGSRLAPAPRLARALVVAVVNEVGHLIFVVVLAGRCLVSTSTCRVYGPGRGAPELTQHTLPGLGLSMRSSPCLDTCWACQVSTACTPSPKGCTHHESACHPRGCAAGPHRRHRPSSHLQCLHKLPPSPPTSTRQPSVTRRLGAVHMHAGVLYSTSSHPTAGAVAVQAFGNCASARRALAPSGKQPQPAHNRQPARTPHHPRQTAVPAGP
jgi:hypothetical protein